MDGGDWILAAQRQDPDCDEMFNALVLRGKGELQDGRMEQKVREYKLKNGKIYYCGKIGNRTRTLLYLPRAIRRQIVRDVHEQFAHPGVDATMEAMWQRFWFPKLRNFVKSIIGSCVTCLMHKEPGGRKPGKLNIITREKVPWHTVHLDHVGPFIKSGHGLRHILVATCHFSKFTILAAVKSTGAAETCRKVRAMFTRLWVPTRVISDRGTAFTNTTFAELCAELGVHHVLTSTENPRANGQVERMNRTIIPMLAGLTQKDDGSDWSKYLERVETALNSRTSQTTRKTPMEILYGFQPRTILESRLAATVVEDNEEDTEAAIAENRDEAHAALSQAQIRQKRAFDRHRGPNKTYDIGDVIVVRRKAIGIQNKAGKLASLYRGPLRVCRKISDTVFEVESFETPPKYRVTAPIDQLKKWDIVDDATQDDDDEEETSGADDK
uniref:RNA-directed DNA polymerase n=1 Tax=Strigamia maritima TaxID=126957 RepID=T1JHH2_STRMM